MDAMLDVLSLGEILVDWISTVPGVPLHQANAFIKAAGGAPANTAVSLARQSIQSAFIGRVAMDHFGGWLRSVLIQEGINTEGLIEDPDAQTRMAYIVTTLKGGRKVETFTQISVADSRLCVTDLKDSMFRRASVYHFGSISMIESRSFAATQKAIELAKQHQLLISFDPNIRHALWQDKEHCRQTILDTLAHCHMVKMSENELFFLTGSTSIDEASLLRQKYNIPLLIITQSQLGATFYHDKGDRHIPGFNIELVEDTGAGDAFNAGTIAAILPLAKAQKTQQLPYRDQGEMITSLNLNELSEFIIRGNAIGALTCTKKGAIPSLPYKNTIDAFLQQNCTEKCSQRSGQF